MDNVIKEKSIFCFRAILKKVDSDECFLVPFKVLAKNQYVAKSILLDWLKEPKQTGYKFAECDGLIQDASDLVLVSDKSERGIESYTREINRVLGDKDTTWLRDTDLQKIRKILSEIDSKFGRQDLIGE